MQRNNAAQAHNRKSSARTWAQLERVAAIRAVQIGQMISEEFVSFDR